MKQTVMISTPHSSQLHKYGKQLARNGDMDGAIKIFQRAKELDPSLDLDPKAEAQKLAAEGQTEK